MIGMLLVTLIVRPVFSPRLLRKQGAERPQQTPLPVIGWPMCRNPGLMPKCP